MTRDERLRRKIRLFTWVFIVGLVVSGATAIPLRTEVEWLAGKLGAGGSGVSSSGEVALWLGKVREALRVVEEQFPFLSYGADWLAFGHFVIAIVFLGPLRDPVRNRWLYQVGMIACVLVIPYAFIFGTLRGIPLWWRLIDCSFGVLGFVPLWICNKWSAELERAGI
jgi:hypothetical protein